MFLEKNIYLKIFVTYTVLLGVLWGSQFLMSVMLPPLINFAVCVTLLLVVIVIFVSAYNQELMKNQKTRLMLGIFGALTTAVGLLYLLFGHEVFFTQTIPQTGGSVSKNHLNSSLQIENKLNEKPKPNLIGNIITDELAATFSDSSKNIEKYENNSIPKPLQEDSLQSQDEISVEKKANIDNVFKDIFDNVGNKDWDALLKTTENFDIDGLEDKAMLTFALTQAISNGAPLDVLVDFLNRGAELNVNILFAVALRQDVEIAKVFVDYGMDLDLRDVQGRNALYYSLSDLRKRNMFEYLVSNGVSTKTSDTTNDLMSTVLAGCDGSANVFYYIKRLLSLGEIIHPVHREIYFDLVLNNKLCVKKISPFFMS
jgi:hypothetical protein